MKFFKKIFIQYLPSPLQQAFRRIFIWPLKRLIGFVILIVREIWLPIHQIEHSGLTVILIGDQAVDPYLIYLLSAEYLKPIRIGTVALWSLNRVMQYWEEKADFIIFRHRRFLPAGSIASRMLSIPYYVAQSIELPPSDVDLQIAFRNSQTRADLKRIRNTDFEYEATQNQAQLEFFYHQMYRPYTLDRHRNSAEIPAWDAFRQAYEKMELLLVRKDGRLVAGNLISQTGDCYTCHALGILNADRELLKAGALVACYWFSIVEAHRRGCSTINTECARPFLKDGVLVYKKKWGGRIVPDHRERELWFLPCGNSPEMYRFLEENPFICERDGRLTSLIFLGSHTVLNDNELSIYLKCCHFQGDCLSTWVVLLSQEWAGRAEAIQNTLRELSSPSHIVDLSEGTLTELPERISSWHDLSCETPTGFSQLAYSR